MEAKNKYHIYIPSKGRSDSCRTAHLCLDAGLNFSIVVEPQDYLKYSKVFGKKNLIKLPKNDQGMWYVRNFILKLSRSRNEKAHWQIDDDIKYFAIRKDGKNTRSNTGTVLSEVEKILDAHTNIKAIGTRLAAFAFSYESFLSVNTQIWASWLVDNDVDAKFKKGTVEDLDFFIQIMHKGGVVVAANRYIHDTFPHNAKPGGLTVENPDKDPRIQRQLTVRKDWPQYLRIAEQDLHKEEYVKLSIKSKMFEQKPILKRGSKLKEIPNSRSKKDKSVNKQVETAPAEKITYKANPEMTVSKIKSLKDAKPAKYNPRKITDEALEKLNKSIESFGDLSGVVINNRTGTIVAGHQRIKTFSPKKTKLITKPVKDEFGTLEVGHIVVKATSKEGSYTVPLRIVDWDVRTEKLANIAANSHGGEFDNQKLGVLLADLDRGGNFDIEMVGISERKVQALITKEGDAKTKQKYVRKLDSPIYQVTGKKPIVSQIYDRTRTEELQESIKKAKLPKEIHDFLMAAAERHTRFRFDVAAEYYAHADKKTQKLMEDCAMIIVDHGKAIELGYLKLTEQIMDMVE